MFYENESIGSGHKSQARMNHPRHHEPGFETDTAQSAMNRSCENLLSWSFLLLFFVLSCSTNAATPPSTNYDAAFPSPLIAEVLMRVQLDYVDPERLLPQRMLQGALDELSIAIPEIQVNSRFEQKSHAIDLKVENQNEEITYQSLRDLDELNQLLQQMVSSIKGSWSASAQIDKVEQALIVGLLSELDPHSTLLAKEIYEEFQVNTRGNFGGVGIVVGIRNNQMIVITPIEGTPAAKAGIRAMDRIVRIGDEETENMNMADTVNKLRGQAGSPITLHIMRPGFSAPKKIELMRTTIQIDSVESVDLTPQPEEIIRYIKIKNFQQNTDEDLASKLRDIDQLKGLIIDIRNNPGGLLYQAVRVSDYFLPDDKTIVATLGNLQNSSSYRSHWGLNNKKLVTVPIIVLINNGSASASEILAAALKNNERAILIGEQTFGKGSIQTIESLQDNSALKLTVARYLTPGDQSIQSIGVTPDIALYPVVISDDQLRLIREKDYREENLRGHFQVAEQAGEPLAALPYVVSEVENPDDVMVRDEYTIESLNEDFFIEIARKILNEYQGDSDQTLLETALQVQKDMMPHQDARIVEALGERDIDWQHASSKTDPQLQVEIQSEMLTSSRKNWIPAPALIPAESQVRFRVSVKNVGSEPVSRLISLTGSDHSVFDGHQLPFGYLAPGESQVKTFEMEIPKEMNNSVHAIDFEFLDHQLRKRAADRIFLASGAAPAPKFSFRLELFDDGRFGSQGNGDQVLQAGEKIALRLKVLNSGDGDSEDSLVLLRNRGEQTEVVLSRSRFALGALPSGDEKEALLLFQVNDHAALETLELFIEVHDVVSSHSNLVYQFSPHQSANAFYQAPTIDYELKDPANKNIDPVTKLKTVELKGIALDDQQMKDVYIVLNEKKIFYRSNLENNSLRDLPFSTMVQLEEGHNRILIFARDQDHLTALEEIQLWRERSS